MTSTIQGRVEPAGRRVNVLRLSPRPGSKKYASILMAAEALFGEHGFRRSSVDEIATRADVSKPLIYRYFRSKKDLFEVVVDRVIDEWCEAIRVAGSLEMPSAADSLRQIVRASLEFAQTRGGLRGLLARESQLILSGYSDVLERGTATLRSVLIETLERGVDAGEIRTDIDLERMADVVTEICVGFGDRMLSDQKSDGDGTLLDAIIETVLHGVVTQRER